MNTASSGDDECTDDDDDDDDDEYEYEYCSEPEGHESDNVTRLDHDRQPNRAVAHNEDAAYFAALGIDADGGRCGASLAQAAQQQVELTHSAQLSRFRGQSLSVMAIAKALRRTTLRNALRSWTLVAISVELRLVEMGGLTTIIAFDPMATIAVVKAGYAEANDRSYGSTVHVFLADTEDALPDAAQLDSTGIGHGTVLFILLRQGALALSVAACWLPPALSVVYFCVYSPVCVAVQARTGRSAVAILC